MKCLRFTNEMLEVYQMTCGGFLMNIEGFLMLVRAFVEVYQLIVRFCSCFRSIL